MIANYGYRDGLGDFFISVDAARCDGCAACARACPRGVMVVGEDPNDPFREAPVAMVSERHRNKLAESCAKCKAVTDVSRLACVAACRGGALEHSW